MRNPRKPCAADDCDRVSDWLGYCGKHAWRFKIHGDANAPVKRHEPQSGCSVDGCQTKAVSLHLCAKHLARWKVHGDVHHNERPQWGTDDIGYTGSHLRTRRVRGPAKLQQCVTCTEAAHHWAYDHADPNERIDAVNGLVYSPDPDHYQPMCTPCHSRFDSEWTASTQVESAI